MNCSECKNCSDFSRNMNGESVFTGFIQKNQDVKQIYWVGKDEKIYPRHINVENPTDVTFFMTEMKQYDR